MNPILAKLIRNHPNRTASYKDLYKSKPGDCFNVFEAVEITTEDGTDWLVTSCKAQIMTNDGNYVELICLPHTALNEKFHTINSGGLVFYDENHDLERIVVDEDETDHIVWLENCQSPDFKYECPPENAYTLEEFLALPAGTKVKIREYNYFSTLTRIYMVSNTTEEHSEIEILPFDNTAPLNFFVEDKLALPTKVFFPKRTAGRFCVAFPAN